jgi:WD40 repeat protein
MLSKHTNILGIKPNNSRSLVVVGIQQGFIVYKPYPELEKRVVSKLNGGIASASIFNKTNLFVLIGGGEKANRSSNYLVLWDEKNKNEISVVDLHKPIRNGFIAKDRMIVVCDREIMVLNYHGNKIVGRKITYCNSKGLCSISYTDEHPDNITIATLGLKKGEISIWNPRNDDYKQIEAHNGNITVIKLSPDGSLVATASENGTLIHVYDTKTCQEVHTLRRGSNVLANVGIHDICIRNDNKYLACSSTNGTIHIFDLCPDKEKNKNKKSVMYFASEYLPDYFSDNWSCIQHQTGSYSKCIMFFDPNNILHVFNFEDDYYRVEGSNYESLTRKKLHTNNI